MPNHDLIALHENLAQAERNLADAKVNVAYAEAAVEHAKTAIAKWEGVHPDRARRRGHLRRIVTIPIAIGVSADAVKRIFGAPRRMAQITGSALTMGAAVSAVSAVSYAVIQTPSQPQHRHSRPAITAPARLDQPNPAKTPTSPRPSTRPPRPPIPAVITASTTPTPTASANAATSETSPAHSGATQSPSTSIPSRRHRMPAQAHRPRRHLPPGKAQCLSVADTPIVDLRLLCHHRRR